MKDIPDYFGSPAKILESTQSASENKTFSANDTNKSKIKSVDITNDVQNEKKRNKKRSKRKSDPAIKNIAEMLSTSLSIISPNSSVNDSKTETKHNKTQSENIEKEVIIVETDIVILEEPQMEETSQSSKSANETGNSDSDCSKLKLNAFQFMMESRNKSIVQNSPGKEKTQDDAKSDNEEKLRLLSVRKSLLQNWADRKGSSKRKREDEEREEIIKYKLTKRAKRLKKLLKVDNVESDENDVRLSTRRRRIKKISSSSSENTKDSIIELSPESNKHVKNSVPDVIEENAQDTILDGSKTKGNKQSLLTFFGVVNKTKKSEKDDNEWNVKLNTPKSKISELETCKTSKKSQVIDLEDSSADTSVKLKKVKSKKHKKVRNETFEESLSNKTPKTPKNGTKNDDDQFTPRSQKSWKMRIKISEENSEKAQMEIKTTHTRPQRTRRVTDYKLLFSDDCSIEGDVNISRKERKKPKPSEAGDIIICSDDESNKKKDSSKAVKVAPVFAKATPKPKLAPEIIEARKQFLMSGIPDSLKRNIEKQQIIEDREYEIFPSISHVQQKCKSSKFWNLPSPQLHLRDRSPLKIEKPAPCANITNSHVTSAINIRKEVEKVDKLKSLLNKIKADNPNYPVYKSFRLICEKSGKNFGKKRDEVLKPKINNHSRKTSTKDVEIIDEMKPVNISKEQAMWTEKYKPRCADDIMGNAEGVKKLKTWLGLWKNFSEEINAKRKRNLEGSDSEFESTDGDSRDSTKLPGNTVVVGGPCGSGKSSAIYAICHELGLNVIELNASSKRTGKRLLLELQEATQSHQVRKKGPSAQNFFLSKENIDKRSEKKMCVLLVEDVDIVFEQDDGFISALSQIVSTSKRPVVMTTTDTSSIYVQKFLVQYEYIPFLSLSAQSLAAWLQIMCLVEGIFTHQGEIGNLLEYNKGDVRKTLLQLQFWVQSGGQILKGELPLQTQAVVPVIKKKSLDDDQELVLEEDGKETGDFFIHSGCILSFEIFKHDRWFRVPFHLNLGLLWWNIPNILHIPSFSVPRIEKLKKNFCELNRNIDKSTSSLPSKKLTPTAKRKLESVSDLYDSMAFTEVAFGTIDYFRNSEPEVKNYTCKVRDSLELSETMDFYDGSKEFVHELTHGLVNGYVEELVRMESSKPALNLAMPDKMERRWRANVHVCEDVLLEAVPLSNRLERRGISLDYMPFLRSMSRSESQRAAANTKRGNRFRSYFRGLGINYNDNTLKIACNILVMDEL